MVFQLQLRNRLRRPALAAALACLLASASAQAASGQATQYLSTARDLYSQGQYFRAARFAFASIENGSDGSDALRSEAYAVASTSLIHARFYNAASYFFIRTLQSGNRPAIRRALADTQDLLVHVGADLLRKYLIRHTQYEDYDLANRSAYLYSLGKEAVLRGEFDKAVGFLNGIQPGGPVWPYALQLRASAFAVLNQGPNAIEDFKECQVAAPDVAAPYPKDSHSYRIAASEAEDLAARCQAGVARTLYQMEKFDAADRAYDQIQKASLVWPDILFEQAWNAFARQEYNRTLGKLVSYKSPALQFVFNPENDVLRAQSYLALCLYDDANSAINEFNGRYSAIGVEVKRFVEGHARDLPAFYEAGRNALRTSIYSTQGMDPMLNRFVRGPYFAGFVRADTELAAEQAAIARLGATAEAGRGFPGFLAQVLSWRSRSIRSLGGMYVKNSLMDYHQELVSNFEKMSFIKLEMLKRAKDLLVYKHPQGDRSWGNVIPSRRDYQLYWSFNGEFWNDELGDYVFGLESECGKAGPREYKDGA